MDMVLLPITLANGDFHLVPIPVSYLMEVEAFVRGKYHPSEHSYQLLGNSKMFGNWLQNFAEARPIDTTLG